MKEEILSSTTKSTFSLTENLSFHYLGFKKKNYKWNKILLFQTFSLDMHIFVFMSFNNKNSTLTVTWEHVTPDLLVVVSLWMVILAQNHHLHDLSYWLQYIYQLQLRLSRKKTLTWMKIAGLVLVSVHIKNERPIPLSVKKAKSYLKNSTSITKSMKIKSKYVYAYMSAPNLQLQSKHRLKAPSFLFRFWPL